MIQAHIAPGADRDAALRRLSVLFDGPSIAVRPTNIGDFGGVEVLPLLIAAVFTAAGGHRARARPRHLHPAPPARPRGPQNARASRAHRSSPPSPGRATTIAAIGLLVGLPLGIGVGRFAWNMDGQDLGVVPEAVTPIGLSALVVPATILLANLIAALPAPDRGPNPAGARAEGGVRWPSRGNTARSRCGAVSRRWSGPAIHLAGLAGLVLVVYLVVVIGIGRVPTSDEKTLPGFSMAAAAVAALLYQPLRGGLSAASRTGSRAPSAIRPARPFAHSAAGCRARFPLDELLLQLAESLRKTLVLEAAEVWTGSGGLSSGPLPTPTSVGQA